MSKGPLQCSYCTEPCPGCEYDLPDYRVIVTGSRDWPELEEWRVFRPLKGLLLSMQATRCLVVVHGACPRGVDSMASMWARAHASAGWNVTEEPHPARWDRYRKLAGFIRNQEMVDAGADSYLTFIKDHSRGATDCLNRLIKARIPGGVYEL